MRARANHWQGQLLLGWITTPFRVVIAGLIGVVIGPAYDIVVGASLQRLYIPASVGLMGGLAIGGVAYRSGFFRRR